MSTFDAYRRDERKMQQLLDLTQAVLARIPKKYEEQLIALFRHFPEASETHLVETTTAYLGLIWHCGGGAEEALQLLSPMTVRSRGGMTSRIGDSQFCLGATIQIQFTIDIAGGPHHGAHTSGHDASR
jgi:hypothetical protein